MQPTNTNIVDLVNGGVTDQKSSDRKSAGRKSSDRESADRKISATAPFPSPWWEQPAPRSGLRVGVLTPGYALEKVSYALRPPGVTYTKLNRLPFQRFCGPNSPFVQCPFAFGPHTDLIHTFNYLPLNRRFVVSFEAELPRFLDGASEALVRRGYDLLRSDRCRAILALSEAGYDLAAANAKRFGAEDILRKMSVFYGGMDAPDAFSGPNPARESGPIRLCFAGNKMVRKGVYPTLLAAEALRKQGLDLRLTVIGRPETSTYVAPTRRFDTDALLKRLQDADWIDYRPGVPYAELVEILWNTHIQFCPTLDDTVGFIAIDAALCGATRAATDIFAIPEIVNDGVDGWLAEVEKRDDRRWRPVGEREAAEIWDETQQSIADQLVAKILASDPTRERLIEMGETARTNTRAIYDVRRAGERLAEIYQEAVA